MMDRCYRPYDQAPTELNLLKTGCARITTEQEETYKTVLAQMSEGCNLGVFTIQTWEDDATGQTRKQLLCREISDESEFRQFMAERAKYSHYSFWAVPITNFFQR